MQPPVPQDIFLFASVSAFCDLGRSLIILSWRREERGRDVSKKNTEKVD